MDLLLVLLLALSCNLDNVAIGLSYGLRGIRLPLSSNLLIAILTGGGTLVFIVFGQQIVTVLSPQNAVFTGSIILMVMGAWVLGQEFWGHHREDPALNQPIPAHSEDDPTKKSLWLQITHILKDPSLADKDTSGHIDLKESLLLSLALMLNNIPNGLGAGMLRLPAFFTASIVGLLSILTFLIGMGAGKSLGHCWLGLWAGRISGVLLIILGVVEIFLG
jgi:putative sporulation protein YtaF